MLNSIQAGNAKQNTSFGINKHVRMSSLLTGTPVENLVKRHLVKLTNLAESNGKKLYVDSEIVAKPNLNPHPSVLSPDFSPIEPFSISYEKTGNIVLSSAPAKNLFKRAMHRLNRLLGAQDGVVVNPEKLTKKELLSSAGKTLKGISA